MTGESIHNSEPVGTGRERESSGTGKVALTPVTPIPSDSEALVPSPSTSMSGVRKPEATAITSASLIVQSCVGFLSNRFLSVAPVEPAAQLQLGGVPPTSQLASNNVRSVLLNTGSSLRLTSSSEI